MNKIEPRLADALHQLPDSASPLEVVLRFDLPTVDSSQGLRARRALQAEAATKEINQAIARAGVASGETPLEVSSFPMMGSAMVRATRAFVMALVEQECVTGATLNTSRPER